MVPVPSYTSASYLAGLVVLVAGIVLPLGYMVYKNRKMFRKNT